MALKVCVKRVAPAIIPAMPCSWFAALWPIETWIPYSFVSLAMWSTAPASSGARVRILMECSRFSCPYTASRDVEVGMHMMEASCAPFFEAARKGPSTWAPSTDAWPGVSSGLRKGRTRWKTSGETVGTVG